MTPEKLVAELDKTINVPGIANVCVPLIRNRLDMLATGNNIADIECVAQQIEQIVKTVRR
ncbi:MAG: putative cation efflux system transrane protein [Proteobacteria bacterium]|nr:putative cation efflux system transrane protein [Pseudomonadota bacterium]